jgi:homoserine dehydrogenase
MKRIGLFGFGQVGQGLFEIIKEVGYEAARIEKIAVRNPTKKRSINLNYFVFDPNEILNDPQIDLVVEAIDIADEAFEIVRQALLKGKPVVTANKKMLAQHLGELLELQKETGTPLLYEGAVCGAIPVIQTIEKYFSREKLRSVQGIFNGTSNYILSKIFNENLNYQTALKQAQKLGFAETDPTNDVQAFDPKFKTIILAKHAFGVLLRTDDVINFGIDNLKDKDIEYARANQLRIKVLPTLFSEGTDFFAYVLPHFVGPGSMFYGVENEFNAVEIDAPFAGKQFYYGRGAGSLPTGAAVFNDVQDLIDGRVYPYTKSNQNTSEQGDLILEVYLRYTNENIKEAIPFEKISKGYISPEYSYVIGTVSLINLSPFISIIQESGSSIIATGKREVRPYSHAQVWENDELKILTS